MMKLVGLVTLAACAMTGAYAQPADPKLREEALRVFGRIEAPAAHAADTAEARLGRALFWDARLSLDGKTACATCHLEYGADLRRASVDAKGLPTSRNSPTVFNSVGQPSIRWLGDRKTLADQAEGSITGSLGFASKQELVDRLVELRYEPLFTAAYPAEPGLVVSARNYGRALEAYEATLATPAPFDRFLAGDGRALDARQKAGLRRFMDVGCASCHSGRLLGGGMFAKFGLARDYWLETGSPKPDEGRYAVTKKDEDKYVFRVPMLRNVAKTAPYFHDGSVETLDRAVRIMGAVQLGKALSDGEVASIVAFLASLTGDVPPNYAPPPR
ncbi:MAG: cytochrome-c peroxidase [Usitatibacter sp.]